MIFEEAEQPAEEAVEVDTGPIDPSPLSGREYGLNKPILVLKIDNVKNSRPHEGLASADQVYVERIEAGYSRLVAVYATELPTSVGPIRSARPTDISILRQFGAPAFAYSGAQAKLLPLLDSEPFIDISNRVTGDGWFRAPAPRFAPHNLMVNPSRLLELAEQKGNVSRATSGFSFSREFHPDAGRTSGIRIEFPASSTEFKWVAGQGWLVYFDDVLATDSLTQQPLAPSTVVVQITQTKSSGLKDSYGKDVPDQELIGSGKAYLLRNGKSLELTWERKADIQFPTFSYLGEQMSLKSGQIWFVYASESEVTITKSAATP
jgi:hypothetical protein